MEKKPVHITIDTKTLELAKRLAKELFEGNLSMLIRAAINAFGKGKK
jgi:hypothetical protein